ncbi:MAG TPA: hypothetical protein VHL31_25680 [Geminicoccus sp.]|uniref:hypothetical protein n=1 Tax=Geminicoccus sp. TaxID=2024832 RepID=UPI002E2FCC44|nr:hypothetical protein [Geminicoccus sp.]HEX2529668.1 hypothetical protein [Geminicoccus sp.]
MIGGWLHYAAAPLVLWRLPVARVTGRTGTGEPGSLLIAGANATLRLLAMRLLPLDRRTEQLGSRPWHDLLRRADQAETDLSILRLPSMLADLFDRPPYLVMPDAIGFEAGIEAMVRSSKSKSVSSNLRRSRKSGLRAEITQGDRDFDSFYHSMYQPYAAQRFGEGALIRTHAQLHRLARRGEIVWLSMPGGPKVAGALVRRNPPALDVISMGTSLLPDEARRLAVAPAIYAACAEHATALGLASLRLGGAMPWLTDGVLRFKVNWGATLCTLPNVHRRSLVSWHSPSPVVDTLFALAPVLWNGRRHRGVVLDASQATTLTVPGLPVNVVPAGAAASSQALRAALKCD